MARKILIIFALIIAAFPYLGFSYLTDNIVTTTLALFISLALLFSRKPKTIKLSESDIEPKEDMPSPFVAEKMQDIKISHQDDIITYPKILTEHKQDKIETILSSNFENEEIKSTPLNKIPRKKMSPLKAVMKSVEKKEDSSDGLDQAIRRSRKNNRTIISEEERVVPADVPVRLD